MERRQFVHFPKPRSKIHTHVPRKKKCFTWISHAKKPVEDIKTLKTLATAMDDMKHIVERHMKPLKSKEKSYFLSRNKEYICALVTETITPGVLQYEGLLQIH